MICGWEDVQEREPVEEWEIKSQPRPKARPAA
jgi:hypothetical protein